MINSICTYHIALTAYLISLIINNLITLTTLTRQKAYKNFANYELFRTFAASF